MKLTQPMVFDIVWRLSGGKSFISGIPLMGYYNSKFHFNMFAHVLSKSGSKYPFFKLYIGNIVLVSPQEHHVLDHGSSDLRKTYEKGIDQNFNGYVADWDKWDRKEAELIELYSRLFPKMKDGIIWKYTDEEVMGVVNELNKGFMNN